MFNRDYCWRFEHSAGIADDKQRRNLFAGEHFRFGDYYPNMVPFRDCGVVNFAQIGE
jgi:hypothetical protein